MRCVLILLLICFACISYASEENPPTGTMGKYVDARDGYSYRTITVGNREWFAENLKYEGDIHLGTNRESNKPTRYYPNGKSDNVSLYGYLYNWVAAEKACPSGWRLPTNSDWRELRNSFPGENVGSQMATREDLWNNGTLERASGFGKSGFDVLPAGSFDGEFGNFGSFAYFWTSNEYEYFSGNAYYQYIYYNYTGVAKNYSSKMDGFSVRCVRDKQ